MFEKDNIDNVEKVFLEIYERLCLGEFLIVDNVRSLLVFCFFDLKCYDFVSVGCYKINKKLYLKNCLFN